VELPLDLKLIEDISCADEAQPDRLVDTGDSRVVESPLGPYREAGQERYSRFAYRFRVGNLGRPHLLVVSYPDDRERTMDIHVSTPTREGEPPERIHPVHVQSGACTGGEYPLTNRIHEHTCFFWPEETDHAVILMTWATGCPAAAQRIQIYEIQSDLPALEVTSPEGSPGRDLGLCWEDASVIGLLGATEATPETWRRTIERLADYMAFIGCNLMTYPVCIYDGPYYGSSVESIEGLNKYRLAIHPGDWVGAVLKVFERRGLRFIASMTLASTPSLKAMAQGDEQRLASGGDVVSQALADNSVATERNINTSGPQFDPIHPKVQERLLALVEELVTRYGDSPTWAGVAINIWGASIGWFGTLEVGYGDYDIALFERETGVVVPARADDAERFRRRYEWLMENAREQWIDWRCRKVADLFLRMNAILQAKRRDLRLVLSFFIPYGLTATCPFDLQRWQGGKSSVYEMHREGGIDVNMLRGVPGLVLDKILQPCDFRLRACNLYSEDRSRAIEHLESRDLNFDPENLAHMAVADVRSAWLYNRYFESTPEGRLKVSPSLAEGAARFEADQWWKLLPGWTYGAVTPGHQNFMEWYVLALAAFDPVAISSGGLTVGTMGHEERVRRFARAFRALPAVDFLTLEGATDPVTIRYVNAGGALYCYMVNQEPVPAAVELNLAGLAGVGVTDLGEDLELPLAGPGSCLLELEPFGFRSLRIGSASARIAGARTHLPEHWTAKLKEKAEALQRAHAARKAGGTAEPEDEIMLRECSIALEQGRWGRVRHLVQSQRAARITGALPF